MSEYETMMCVTVCAPTDPLRKEHLWPHQEWPIMPRQGQRAGGTQTWLFDCRRYHDWFTYCSTQQPCYRPFSSVEQTWVLIRRMTDTDTHQDYLTSVEASLNNFTFYDNYNYSRCFYLVSSITLANEPSCFSSEFIRNHHIAKQLQFLVKLGWLFWMLHNYVVQKLFRAKNQSWFPLNL